VTFYDGATAIGTSPLANGIASLTYAGFTTVGSHSVTAVYSGDTNYATSTSSVVAVAAVLNGTTTTITASTASTGAAIPFSLTAKVVSQTTSTAAITGSVTFLQDGVVTLGKVTVANGSATFSNISIAQIASHSFTAVYSGDANYATSTTANPAVVAIVTQGFSVSANPTSLTITRGTAATTTITGTSFGNYSGTVHFTCSGIPANSFCNFDLGDMIFNGTNNSPVMHMTIVTIAPSARGVAASGFLWIPAMLLGGLFVFRRKQFSVRGRQFLMLAVLFCGVMAVSGCGRGLNPTPTGSSTIVITANGTGTASNNPNITQTLNIAVTVQ